MLVCWRIRQICPKPLRGTLLLREGALLPPSEAFPPRRTSFRIPVIKTWIHHKIRSGGCTSYGGKSPTKWAIFLPTSAAFFVGRMATQNAEGVSPSRGITVAGKSPLTPEWTGRSVVMDFFAALLSAISFSRSFLLRPK